MSAFHKSTVHIIHYLYIMLYKPDNSLSSQSSRLRSGNPIIFLDDFEIEVFGLTLDLDLK